MAHEAKFGALIDEQQQRDAIHVAIAPVIATERLSPGDHVGLVDGTDRVGKTLPGITFIGIIDPFLRDTVEPGERCWLLLYQQTITSLRHEWTHPAFAVPEETLMISQTAVSESEAWLQRFCEVADCPGYESVMALIENGTIDGEYGRSYLNDEYLHFNGTDAHGEIPFEFWHHVEIVTGRKMTKRPSSFSCSC